MSGELNAIKKVEYQQFHAIQANTLNSVLFKLFSKST